MGRLLLPVAFAATLLGCDEPALVPMKGYCERERGSSTKDCIFFNNDKDGDPATIGHVSVASRAQGGGFVHRAGKKKYTVHRAGKIAGSIVITGDDPDWIEVTLTDGEPYKKTMRIEGPGGLME